MNAPLIQGTACQKDHAASRRPIAYLYSRENEAEARQVKVLTADEARPDRDQHHAAARAAGDGATAELGGAAAAGIDSK